MTKMQVSWGENKRCDWQKQVKDFTDLSFLHVHFLEVKIQYGFSAQKLIVTGF